MAREACDAGAAGLALLGLAPSKVEKPRLKPEPQP